jgi:trehalose 6-phosphate phosphatase
MAATSHRDAGSRKGMLTPPPPGHAGCALFLDVDGTLIEFHRHPDDIAIDPELQALLAAVADGLGGALALVSGRSLTSIDSVIGLPALAAAGLHGAEVRRGGAAAQFLHDENALLDVVGERADRLLQAWPGAFVEHKGRALALHYRLVPEAADAVAAIGEQLLQLAGPGFELQFGNLVCELKPHGTNKGTAIDFLMRDAPFAGREAWMFGDDLTDEHGFAAANDRGGGSVIVGSREPTAARYRLEDPPAMRAWLAELRGRLTVNTQAGTPR